MLFERTYFGQKLPGHGYVGFFLDSRAIPLVALSLPQGHGLGPRRFRLQRPAAPRRRKAALTREHHGSGGRLRALGVLLLLQGRQHAPQIQLHWNLALLSTIFITALKNERVGSSLRMVYFTTMLFTSQQKVIKDKMKPIYSNH